MGSTRIWKIRRNFLKMKIRVRENTFIESIKLQHFALRIHSMKHNNSNLARENNV